MGGGGEGMGRGEIPEPMNYIMKKLKKWGKKCKAYGTLYVLLGRWCVDGHVISVVNWIEPMEFVFGSIIFSW